MKPSRWWYTTAPALAGLTAALILKATAQSPAAAAGLLAGSSLLGLVLSLIKKWVTDASNERQALRFATKDRDEAREQANLAEAMTAAERERCRAEAAAARTRADQAEINFDQRARAAERRAEEQIAAFADRTAAEAAQCLAEEIARLRREHEENYALIKTQSYEQGVDDALSGRIDMIVLDAPDADVIDLDDRRPTGTEAREARNS